MSLVFGVLMAQLATLVLLLLPLPHRVRSKLLDVSAMLQKSTNYKVGVIFVTALLGLQFMDCLNKVKRYSHMTNPYFAQMANPQQMTASLLFDQLASKFYAQRNLYITGAVLYLEMAIYTVITILRKLVYKENAYRASVELRKAKPTDGSEAEKLRSLILLRVVDIATMKKQLEGVQSSYDKLTPAEARSKDD